MRLLCLNFYYNNDCFIIMINTIIQIINIIFILTIVIIIEKFIAKYVTINITSFTNSINIFKNVAVSDNTVKMNSDKKKKKCYIKKDR